MIGKLGHGSCMWIAHARMLLPKDNSLGICWLFLVIYGHHYSDFFARTNWLSCNEGWRNWGCRFWTQQCGVKRESATSRVCCPLTSSTWYAGVVSTKINYYFDLHKLSSVLSKLFAEKHLGFLTCYVKHLTVLGIPQMCRWWKTAWGSVWCNRKDQTKNKTWRQ